MNVRNGSSPASRKYLNRGCAVASAHHDRLHLLRHQAGETLGDAHADLPDALRPQTLGGRQHQVGAVGLEQIHRADVGREPLANQRGDVGQRFRGVAVPGDQQTDLIERQERRNQILDVHVGGIGVHRGGLRRVSRNG